MRLVPRSFAIILVAAACTLTGRAATAQQYPNKLISIVVANAPGDLADVSSRLLAPEMSRILGQTIIVVNKPGAGTLVGSDYVAREAPADGYTIAAISVNALLILPLTVKEVRFDPLKDLPPFVNLVSGKLVLASGVDQPWKTFDEMIANAKANPGKLNYGSSSSTTRLLTEIVLRARGINVVYVPYTNTAANMADLIKGLTQMGITTEAQAISTGDRFRILAQTGEKRSNRFPSVPTFAELGFPQLRGSSYSFNLRGGTPKPIVDKLNAVVTQVLKGPEVRVALEKLAVEIAAPDLPDAVVKQQAELARAFTETALQIGLQPE